MDSLYSESAYYRMLFAERTEDLPFYLRATEGLDDGGEVLELGVGDGRVAIPLAAAGRRLTGVDLSASMLASLEARLTELSPEVASRISVELGDSRTVRLGRRFARVLCPFNGIAHFHDAEALDALLETVRAHLAPGGLFAFDVMIPDPALLTGGAASVPWLLHPRTGAVCRMEERYDYDPARHVLTITTSLIERERDGRQDLVLSLRQFAPGEIAALLAAHGFDLLAASDELGDSLAYLSRLQ